MSKIDQIHHCTSFGPQQQTCQMRSRPDEQFLWYANNTQTDSDSLICTWIDVVQLFVTVSDLIFSKYSSVCKWVLHLDCLPCVNTQQQFWLSGIRIRRTHTHTQLWIFDVEIAGSTLSLLAWQLSRQDASLWRDSRADSENTSTEALEASRISLLVIHQSGSCDTGH